MFRWLSVIIVGGKATQMRIVQTSFDTDAPELLRELPPVEMRAMVPDTECLRVNSVAQYQEIVGFGGAFTEASATNWANLSKKDQARVAELYFGDPADGGNGFTMGRVPMGSCGFDNESYTFDDFVNDTEMELFDKDIAESQHTHIQK